MDRAMPRTVLLSGDRQRERAEIQQRLEAFDAALNELRQAKDRLQVAANLYLERLEGTKKRAKRDR